MRRLRLRDERRQPGALAALGTGHRQHVASLEEYVLVSQDARRVEVRRRGERGWSAEVAEADDTIEIHGRPIAVATLDG